MSYWPIFMLVAATCFLMLSTGFALGRFYQIMKDGKSEYKEMLSEERIKEIAEAVVSKALAEKLKP